MRQACLRRLVELSVKRASKLLGTDRGQGVRAEGYSVKPLLYRMKTEARAGGADSPNQTVANRIIFQDN